MAAFEEFLIYKRRIPVRGAILLNHDMDSVVLVKGWKKGANWSFPRGKINKDEDDLICAIREVYEETGYDLQAAGLVPENRQVKHITLPIRDQDMRLYVFRDVPMDTHFEPKTRKEISKIQWWRISDLPGFRKKGQQHSEAASNTSKFYMVASFLRDLRKWIMEQKKEDARRASSNQYLSAVISHDEFLTEEDLGADSTQETSHGKPSILAIDTLEGATAALKSLLKVQPPTQGLQSDAIKSPVPRDSGSELLALLQGKAQTQHHGVPYNPAPQTPIDHIVSQPPQPEPPHHQHPRLPHFSSLPPPPVFPIEQAYNSFSYQEPDHLMNNRHEDTFQQTKVQAGRQLPQNQESPRYQPQDLVHPQPLPPYVQRAVFTGGPVHAPMVPQPDQQYAPQLQTTLSVTAQNPQFPGIHSPMVPTVLAQSPPKLTSHKLALLNAFKARDEANEEHAKSIDLPLRRYVQGLASPQELPAETPQSAPVDLLALFNANDSPAQTSNQAVPSPRPPISQAQKSTLLGLFKSPPTSTATVRPAATALPISTTPSAVELSAVEPHSNARPVSASNSKANNSDSIKKSKVIPELNPEANLPFRAMSILTRPPQASGTSAEANIGSTVRTQRAGKKQGAIQGNRSQQENNVHVKRSPAKPFQPQILKRPQQGSSEAIEAAAPESDTFSLLVSQIPTRTSLPLQATPETHSPLAVQPSLDRRSAHTADHKQTLLSLFGKSQSAEVPSGPTSTSRVLSPMQPIELGMAASTRSRVGSLASGVDGVSRKSSQAPMSPADKNFLLNYLDTVANGAQH